MKTVVSLSEVILSMEKWELPRVSLDSVRAIRVAVVWCFSLSLHSDSAMSGNKQKVMASSSFLIKKGNYH